MLIKFVRNLLQVMYPVLVIWLALWAWSVSPVELGFGKAIDSASIQLIQPS